MKKNFNKIEIKKIESLIYTDTNLAKKRAEEFLLNNPNSYYVSILYCLMHIRLGELYDALEILNKLENDVQNDSYLYSVNKEKLLEEIMYYKSLIFFYTKNYNKFYNMYKKDYTFFEQYKFSLYIANLYIARKKGNKVLSRDENDNYILRQVKSYKEEDFLNEVKSHLADYNDGSDKSNNFIFLSDFPFEKVLEEVKKNIPSSKVIYDVKFSDDYFFRYDSNGKEYNRTVNYFKVITFHDSSDIITMYPCEEGDNLPHVDLNYLKNDDIPLSKKLGLTSQIDKFNKKYGYRS